MDFVYCPTNPDLWIRPEKRDDRSEYWEYILLYTDDALCVSKHPERTLRREFIKYFCLREAGIGSNDLPGRNVWKVLLETGVQAWAFGSAKADVKNAETYLKNLHAVGDKRFKAAYWSQDTASNIIPS